MCNFLIPRMWAPLKKKGNFFSNLRLLDYSSMRARISVSSPHCFVTGNWYINFVEWMNAPILWRQNHSEFRVKQKGKGKKKERKREREGWKWQYFRSVTHSQLFSPPPHTQSVSKSCQTSSFNSFASPCHLLFYCNWLLTGFCPQSYYLLSILLPVSYVRILHKFVRF